VCLRVDVGYEAGFGSRDFQEFVGRTQSGPLYSMCNIEHGETLGDDDGVKVDIASPKAFLNIDQVSGFVEEIFAGFERAPVVVIVPENEGALASDNARGFEFGGDVTRRISGAEQNKNLTRRCDGHQQRPGEPTCGAQSRNQK
jgi:hypothetical protein